MLTKLFRRPRRAARTVSRFVPHCEALEDRTLLHAGFTSLAAPHGFPHHALPEAAAFVRQEHPPAAHHHGLALGHMKMEGDAFVHAFVTPQHDVTPLFLPTPPTPSQGTTSGSAPAPVTLPTVTPVTPAPGTGTSQGSTTTATTPTSANPADPTLVQLTLNPLDVNLLGLEVQTNQIQVTVSAQPGNGELLGNVLTAAANLLNLQGVNNALNNVLGSVVTLANSSTLSVSGVNSSGPLSSAAAATTPVLDAYIAPVHLNLLGVEVDTSPIHLTITAHSGQGLVLGNVVTDLANLLNNPPNKLNIDYVNARLQSLLNELNAQIPNIPSAPTTAPTLSSGTNQVLSLTVPPINLNLLGLVLQTQQIQVNATATSGNGELLGNLLTSVLNTLGATPQNIATLNNDLNALLGKVVGVLNASTLTLPANALSTLDPVLQQLALPNLINATGTASAPILNLDIAANNNTPVDVNLLGLGVTTSNINAQLVAQTGQGQVLGNLVYNVANLLNPGGSLSLLTILNSLGV